MADSEAFMYQDIPRNKLQAKLLVNWSVPDIWVTALIVAFFITLWVWLGPLAAVIGGTPVLLLLYRSPNGYGRLHDDITTEFRGLYEAYALGGILWRADDTSNWFVRWLRQRGYRFGRHSTLPFDLAQVKATVDGRVVRYSLLRQTDQPYDHMFITASGGAFASLDVNRKQYAVFELAKLTNQIIAQTHLRVGISYLRISGPFDPSKINEYMRSNMSPMIAQPDLFSLDEDQLAFAQWMREEAEQLRPVTRLHGASEVWYLIVLTIKRGSEWRAAQKGKSNDRQLYDLPIVELGRSMVDSLSSSTLLELQDVRCLGLTDLSMVGRSSWDVAGIEQYYTDRSRGLIPRTDEEVDAIYDSHKNPVDASNAVAEALQTWPQKCIEVSKSDAYIRFDDNYISTIRITRLPERARADQFMALHYIAPLGKWSRLAMVGQSASGDAETRQLVINESALINLNSVFRGNHVVTDPRHLRKRSELSQQAQQISANSISQQFNMLITLVETDPTKLRLLRNQQVAKIATTGFQAEVVRSPGRQLAAAISGILGISRL